MQLEIRPAKPEDAEAIARVHVEASIAAYRPILGSDYSPDLEGRIEIWRRILAHDPTLQPPGAEQVLVARREASIVGFIGVGPSRDSDAAGEGEVHVLYVDPRLWRSGTGKALMDAGIDYLAQRGFAEVTLWVLEENQRARSFYEKEGWRPDGARKGGASRPDVVQIRYRRSLR